MTQIRSFFKHKILFTLALLFIQSIATAQEKKVAPTSNELYREIEKMDEIMFNAFNEKDFEKFKSLFTNDLEWFQDNGGLLNYEKVFSNYSCNDVRPCLLRPRNKKFSDPICNRRTFAGSNSLKKIK